MELLFKNISDNSLLSNIFDLCGLIIIIPCWLNTLSTGELQTWKQVKSKYEYFLFLQYK